MGQAENRPTASSPSRASLAPPRLVEWEITRACPLECQHCPSSGRGGEAELTAGECCRVLDGIASFARPTLILSGGEPLSRGDVYALASRARAQGLPVWLSTCGAMLDDRAAESLRASGVTKVLIWLEGAGPDSHDGWRGVEASFDSAVRAGECVKRAGLALRIRTTVSERNKEELPKVLETAARLGAEAFYPVFLVPRRGDVQTQLEQLSVHGEEELLRWLGSQRKRIDIRIRVACAPQYQRVLRQSEPDAQAAPTAGCTGGKTSAFIDSIGRVYACRYLDLPCGELRQAGYDLRKIWEDSEVFRAMRDLSRVRGRCGICEYRVACGGCRARAQLASGNPMGDDPQCLFVPGSRSWESRLPSGESIDEMDRSLLSALQQDFPIVVWPFLALTFRLKCRMDEIMARIRRLIKIGVIRHLGSVFDGRRFGYSSAMMAVRVPPERLNDAAAEVCRMEEATHVRGWQHRYNLWFTLTAADESSLGAVLEGLRERTRAEDVLCFPTERTFKASTVFVSGGQSLADVRREDESERVEPLSESQKRVVALMEKSLPLETTPLLTVAERWGQPVEFLIVQLRQWAATGAIRHYGAVLSPQKVGLPVAAMVMASGPKDRLDEAGQALAACAEVEQCHRYRSLADGGDLLIATIHGRSRESIQAILKEIGGRCRLSYYEVFFGESEYKDTPVRLFPESLPTPGGRRAVDLPDWMT